jgi:asparagine synthase (glutamine-hydrolysing)
MSGICGIWTGQPNHNGLSRIVQAGLDAIVHRGEDGMSIYPAGNGVLGHCLMDTGCNGMLVGEDGFAISFDGRIDNRDELVARLARGGAEVDSDAGRLNDTVLLLKAYHRFGTSLPQHLRGDFAIAILDPRQKALFLCRDHFGVKPLFYRQAEGALHFASEIKGLKAMAPHRRFEVRDEALQGHVAGRLDGGEPEDTYYEEVFRLLPGHWALVTDQGMEIEAYWKLDPGLPMPRRDGPAQLRKLLRQSVDRRLRATEPVGALLSGGLDSSAIVSLIGAGETRRNRDSVKICSLIFGADDDPDESAYIDAVVNAYKLDSVKVDGSSFTPFQGVDEMVAEQDSPVTAPNLPGFRQFVRRLPGETRTRIFLDGHGGDEVISYGLGIFQELAESGRWFRLWHLLRGYTDSQDMLGGHTDSRDKRKWVFLQLVRRKGLGVWRRRIGRALKLSKAKTEDRTRYTADGRPRPFEQALQLHKLNTRLFATALETLDHNSAAAGLEIRMPFLDVDLVSFCVTVPAREKWAGGLARVILRRALRDILPPEVATRPDKFDFAGRIRKLMPIHHSALVEEVLCDRAGRLAPFADLDDLRGKWTLLRQTGALDGVHMAEIIRAVILSRWLAAQESGPAPCSSSKMMARAV